MPSGRLVDHDESFPVQQIQLKSLPQGINPGATVSIIITGIVKQVVGTEYNGTLEIQPSGMEIVPMPEQPEARRTSGALTPTIIPGSRASGEAPSI